MNIHARASAPAAPPTRGVLGVDVVDLTRDEALAWLLDALEKGRYQPVGWLNDHIANIASEDPRLAAALKRMTILPDGAGVDIAARLFHGAAFKANLNGTDFAPALLKAAARPLTVGLLGARRPVVEAAAAAFKRIAPQHDYVVIHDGFFGPAEEPAILERLAARRPDILLVAMGVPRQEFFIVDRLTPRHCGMPMAVGALFDFMAGAVPRAPDWMRALRLEWLFRLIIEPKRLWRRYVLGNPLFLGRVLRARFGGQG